MKSHPTRMRTAGQLQLTSSFQWLCNNKASGIFKSLRLYHVTDQSVWEPLNYFENPINLRFDYFGSSLFDFFYKHKDILVPVPLIKHLVHGLLHHEYTESAYLTFVCA